MSEKEFSKISEPTVEDIDNFWTRNMNHRRLIRCNLPPLFPMVVTLCGSTRFRKQFEEVNAKLTLKGIIVISVGLFGYEIDLPQDGEAKKKLDRLHFRKIDLSDGIVVIDAVRKRCDNCNKWYDPPWWTHQNACLCMSVPVEVDYIGESTRNEIQYATQNWKKIYYYSQMEQWIDSITIN